MVPCMTILSLLADNQSIHKPQVKWAVSLVTAHDDLNFPQWSKFKLNSFIGLTFIQQIQLIKHQIRHKCIKTKQY